VLYAPQLPPPSRLTVMLSQIVFSGFELLNTAAAGDGGGDSGGMWLEDDSAPFLVVFQYGRSVWAGFPETRVRARFFCPAATPYAPEPLPHLPA
jgi:hypothetical protein